MKNFVMVPRQIKEDLVDGKLSLREFLVLNWIFPNTNPVNGRFEVSYKELVEVFRHTISYESMRQLISSLRRNRYIYFRDHKGKGGKFTIYPTGFQLTNGQIQHYEDFTITTDTKPLSQPSYTLGAPSYNLDGAKKSLVQGFSMDKPGPQITTPYTDTKNDIEIIRTGDKLNELERLRKEVQRLGIKS